MKKPYLALIILTLLCSLILACTLHLGKAQSGTSVGEITSDTTWTEANSPYTLTGNVLVNSGIILIIQAGATVNLGSYCLEVNGTMQAIGTSASLITFSGSNGGYISFTQFSTDWNDSSGVGCIIKNSVLSCALNINSSPSISGDTVYGEIDVANEPPVTAAPSISSCIIEGGLVTDGGGNITCNTIVDQGITLKSEDVSISGNTISGCDIGIYTYTVQGGYGCSVIQNNLVVNDTYGFESSGWTSIVSAIQNNTITDNTYGLYFGSITGDSSLVINNNIYGNTNYNLDNQNPGKINATNNWWGTTDSQTISMTIYDYSDNDNSGIVTYSPFSTGPNLEAPTYITASASAGGSITPSGIISLPYGASQTFTITPNTGYQVANVIVNESSVGSVNSYTIQDINGATTISTTFTPNPTPTPTPSTTNNPTPKPTSTTSPNTNNTNSPTPSPTPNIPEFPALMTIATLMITVTSAIAVLVAIRKTELSKK